MVLYDVGSDDNLHDDEFATTEKFVTSTLRSTDPVIARYAFITGHSILALAILRSEGANRVGHMAGVALHSMPVAHLLSEIRLRNRRRTSCSGSSRLGGRIVASEDGCGGLQENVGDDHQRTPRKGRARSCSHKHSPLNQETSDLRLGSLAVIVAELQSAGG
jgi:hypothetical protein